MKTITIHGSEEMDASDGYHTFTELYEHRITLYLAFLRTFLNLHPGAIIWRSKKHSDGSIFDGWFIVGMGKDQGQQISYHLPMKEWGNTDFIETLASAPTWDGHTPADVVSRLRDLTLNML